MKTSISTFIAILILASGLNTQAQVDQDTVRKNTVKIDLTSYFLYRNSLVFSYERVVKPNQTWGISAGLQALPISGKIDSVRAQRELSNNGYKIAGEYRFYLKKENRYGAPHGVYIGPYLSILNFTNKRHLEVINDSGTPEYVNLKTRIDIINPGVQLGYQFVLNNRWTIDLIFIGPSLSNYRAKMQFEGNYTFDPSDVQSEILNAMFDRFPAFEELVKLGKVSTQGRVNTWAWGYRYQFLVGYHFGRKKK
ncbi:MAG: DUF3575 domain-containing protein [Cyclobacteriaceae bacterium]|nr:DUF3575 domain-containing protein [Cyclobacteriaceae bacterium]